MPTLVILSFLLGAVLGMRFKVLILLPVTALTVVFDIASGIANGAYASTVLIAVVLTAICLQFGYICGIMARYSMVSARTLKSSEISRQVETVG
ncbi:MAG TPA: hypothetical protein VIY68_00145 [Steroidobacteraceae bacterium]